MNLIRTIATAVFCTLVLIAGLVYLLPAHQLRSAFAQSTLPAGSYGFLLNKWAAVSRTSDGAMLGVMKFDGAGNVTGSFIQVSRPDEHQPIQTGTFTGTYSNNADGAGTINLLIPDVGQMTLAMVVTDSGAGIQLLDATPGSDGNGVLAGSARRQ